MKTIFLLRISLVAILLVFGFCIIRPLLESVFWAAIIAFLTSPIHRRLQTYFTEQKTLPALFMTAIFILLIFTPLISLMILLQGEIAKFYQLWLPRIMHIYTLLPEGLARIPFIGQYLQDSFANILNDTDTVKIHMKQLTDGLWKNFSWLISSLSQNVINIIIFTFSLFFFYRDGSQITAQIKKGLNEISEGNAVIYLNSIGQTTFAVFYGVIGSALAQGLAASIGYQLFDLKTPALLGALTAIAALIPFIGTIIIWGPITAGYLLTDETANGIGLLLWCALLVNPIDNIIKPLVISRTTEIPLLPIILGVLGGLFSFGMIGLFIGPIVLSLIMTVWRQWLSDKTL